jgi:hypothetical protein
MDLVTLLISISSYYFVIVECRAGNGSQFPLAGDPVQSLCHYWTERAITRHQGDLILSAFAA